MDDYSDRHNFVRAEICRPKCSCAAGCQCIKTNLVVSSWAADRHDPSPCTRSCVIVACYDVGFGHGASTSSARHHIGSDCVNSRAVRAINDRANICIRTSPGRHCEIEWTDEHITHICRASHVQTRDWICRPDTYIGILIHHENVRKTTEI